MNEYLDFAKTLADEAGQIMLKYFAKNIDKSWKEDNTPLTIADTAINQIVIEKVRAKYPQHGVLGEEAFYEPGRDLTWVVDPIDGTIPYTLGIPVSTFSIALVELGVPIVALIYDPVLKNKYWAIKGGGAFLNDTKISVSTSDSLAQNAITMPAREMQADQKIGYLYDKVPSLKTLPFNLWSFAYCGALVASGQMVGAIFGGESPWDGAAVKLLVEEAGGKTSDINGRSQAYSDKINGMIASNGLVHDQLMELLK